MSLELASPFSKAGTGRVQEQARRFDGIAADDDGFCFLLDFAPLRIEIGDAGDPTVFAQIDSRDHAVVANLCAARDSVWNMRDQRALLGADFASLNAKTTINAVRPVAMGAGKNCHGTTDAHADAQLRASLDQNISASAHGMRPIGIPVRLAPWKICGAGDRHFFFQELVIRFYFSI